MQSRSLGNFRGWMVLPSALAGLVLTIAVLGPQLHAAYPMKRYVFRNTAFGTNNYLQYFTCDDTGEMKLSKVSSQSESGTFWEVERAWDNYRGYKTHFIRNRSNTPYNGYYLTIDSDSGKLMLTKTATTFEYNSYWSIRYVGHEHGRGKHIIQNLGVSRGGHDMSFLTADEKTGEVKLTRKPTAGSNWTMNRVSILPSERIN